MQRDDARVQVVWFKRDLRVHDHAPLTEAARRGPVLALYVVEPAYWRLPDTAPRQWRFVRDALRDLDEALRARGAGLTVCVGDAVEVLRALHAQTRFEALWSHEETGNLWTYARDRAVRRLCRAQAIPWNERPQAGVVRGLRDRDAWAALHRAAMDAPCERAPTSLRSARSVRGDVDLTGALLALADDPVIEAPHAGRRAAIAQLERFLAGGGATYRRGMSSPRTAAQVCSRLSAHLAVGSVSAREVLRRLAAARRALVAAPPDARAVPVAAVDALVARLHWRQHFMQKLEREPEIEVRAQHPFFEAARPRSDPAHPWLLAWREGRTGWPFVDACMRALRATGWLNFRARAMLQCVASHHLGLDWRLTGEHLARCFVDYEPGIHWPQVQMQSGQTGINVPRLYNPVKQSHAQDPTGAFIRRWVPELAHLVGASVHAPWTVGGPPPVRDALTAVREARARLSAVYDRPGFEALADEVWARHGSRARPLRSDHLARQRPTAPTQLALPGIPVRVRG
ncbi:MAG: FAD-binding domain-containing protein [Polyangiales bacterium]